MSVEIKKDREFKRRSEDKPLNKAIFVAVVAAVSTIVSAAFQYRSSTIETEHKTAVQVEEIISRREEIMNSRLKNLRDFSQQQSERIDELKIKNIELRWEISTLRAQLAHKFDYENVFEDLIDGMPGPFWAKEADTSDPNYTDFRMLMINDKFVEHYGVTKKQYHGKRDSDVWGEKTALKFRPKDLYVYENKTRIQYRESYKTIAGQPAGPNNPERERVVWKFYCILPTGKDGVCGLNFIE